MITQKQAVVLFSTAIVTFLAVHRIMKLKKIKPLDNPAIHAIEYLSETSDQLLALLNEKDIDDAETQAALRKFLAAAISFRDTHPKIDVEKRIAQLSPYLETVQDME